MVHPGIFTRRKNYAAAASEGTPLARVLSTLDLTALGVGSTIGVGVYVIAGQVAKEIAGPAVVVSFLIAAIASILSGLCYAEFGARIPKAGSPYVYTYVTVGELVAFIVGWNLILEYVIGAASVARGISSYIDTLAGNTLNETFTDVAPINFSIMGDYFDFFAFGLAILISVALAFGLKESAKLNNIITGLNLLVILFIIIAGAIHSKPENWKSSNNEQCKSTSDGGFLPFGIKGMLKGAATCFYAFVGFDCIAAAGEEVKNPKRALPFAITGSQIIIFLAYFSTSTVLTMMVPFCNLDVNAPFPNAFSQVEFDEAKWIVAIGGICGLITSLFGSMLLLPRILYALASDGLIFKFLGSVNSTFKTPLIGTLIVGLITGIMAGLFDLPQLVHMMSIGTLLAYTLVSTCVLILRYRDAYTYDDDSLDKKPSTKKVSFLGNMFNTSKSNEPTDQSQKFSLSYILIYTTLALVMALLLVFAYTDLVDGELYIIILISVVGGFMIIFLFLLLFQPTTKEVLFFKVPFVPIIPALSILINIYLMLSLDPKTWIRFGIWMFIGILIYLFCIRKSCTNPSHDSPPLKRKSFTNGHANIAFVNDENSSCPSEEKPPSEDSGIARSMENIRAVGLDEDIEIPKKEENVLVMSRKSTTSIEDALAMLDKAIPNDYNDNVYEDINDFKDTEEDAKMRRMSDGNVSTLSSGRLIKEDVVAIVHREDVKSTPTTPVIEIPSAPYEEDNLMDEKEDQIFVKNDSFESEPKTPDSPQASIVFSDFDGETDTDSIDVIIPSGSPQEDLEKYSPHIPRVSLLTKPKTPTPDISPVETPIYNIPPPPPLDGFSNYTPYTIPKVKTVAATTPTADYPQEPLRKISVEEKLKENNDAEEAEGNVRIGDKQHLQLKNKLEKLFMTKAVTQANQPKLTKPVDYPVEEELSGSKTLKPVMSKIISEITKTTGHENEDTKSNASVEDERGKEKLVDESSQATGDIRNRLTEIFRSTRENPSSPKKVRKTIDVTSNEKEPKHSKDLKETNATEQTKEIKDTNDMENHKMRMANAFSTIKSRNIQND